RNPFAFPVKAALAFVARGGAFQVQGLPATVALDAREEHALDVTIAGGSFAPLEDPSVAVRFSARRGRRPFALVLDATREGVRRLRLGALVQRVRMLRERAGDPAATMTVQRSGAEVVAAVEDSGGLAELEARIRVGARVRTGRRGVRIRLPEELEPEGAP